MTNQRVELEVVVGRVGQDDVRQARLEGNNWGWGWLTVGLAGGLGVAGLVTELVNLKHNLLTTLLLQPPGVTTALTLSLNRR